MGEFVNIYSQIQSDDKKKMSLRRCRLEEPEGYSVLDLCMLEIMYTLIRLANGVLQKIPVIDSFIFYK